MILLSRFPERAALGEMLESFVEKFTNFSKLSDSDNILSTNTNPMDCVHENPDDSAEIVIDDDYPVDVERENRIDHSTPASVNLHSKYIALNKKTHSTNVYSDDDDDEMVLLSIPLSDFTQSDGSYTPYIFLLFLLLLF